MRDLLITTIGRYNHLAEWADGKRDYDIAVIVYDGTAINIPCDYVFNFPTFKYPGIGRILTETPSLMEYDYYWMPDEDISASSKTINKLFQEMKNFDLWMGQPSVSTENGSYISWDCFAHKPSLDIIYSNFIEIMCPCFSHEALVSCLPVFNKSKSGWGQDLVWAEIGRDKQKAIINNIVVKHTRPVCGGGLYNKLSRQKVRPAQERKALMRQYDIDGINIKTWI